MSKFLSRKFLLASLFTVTGCGVFAFMDKLTGGEFITLALGVLGVFSGTDAALNAIHKRNSDDGSE